MRAFCAVVVQIKRSLYRKHLVAIGRPELQAAQRPGLGAGSPAIQDSVDQELEAQKVVACQSQLPVAGDREADGLSPVDGCRNHRWGKTGEGKTSTIFTVIRLRRAIMP
jgi:hypothetical protein